MADFVALKHDVDSVTFNSAPINKAMLDDINKSSTSGTLANNVQFRSSTKEGLTQQSPIRVNKSDASDYAATVVSDVVSNLAYMNKEEFTAFLANNELWEDLEDDVWKVRNFLNNTNLEAKDFRTLSAVELHNKLITFGIGKVGKKIIERLALTLQGMKFLMKYKPVSLQELGAPRIREEDRFDFIVGLLEIDPKNLVQTHTFMEVIKINNTDIMTNPIVGLGEAHKLDTVFDLELNSASDESEEAFLVFPMNLVRWVS